MAATSNWSQQFSVAAETKPVRNWDTDSVETERDVCSCLAEYSTTKEIRKAVSWITQAQNGLSILCASATQHWK